MTEFSAIPLLRKITVKDVMRGVAGYKDIEQPTNLFVVYGFARDMREEESTFKDAATGSAQKYHRYFGDFRARRLSDGATFRSTQLILDNFSSDLLQLQFHRVRKDKPEADVNFAYVIGIEPFTRGDETKIRHTLTPINMDGDDFEDPLTAIEERMMQNMPTEFKRFLSSPALTDQREQTTSEKAKAKA